MSRDLSQKLSEHLSLYGYQHREMSIIQPAEIFLTRAGDTIIHRLFVFDRYGQAMALRPEFTSAAARQYVLDKHSDIMRWHFVGPVFEDLPESPFKNQRASVGAELLNAEGVFADQEIITMAAKGVQDLPLADWKLVIGNVALQKHLLTMDSGDNRQYRLLLDQRETLKTAGLDEAEQRLRATLSQLQDEAHTMSNGTVVNSSQPGLSTNRMLDVLLDSTQYGTTMGSRSREDIAERILHKHLRARDAENLIQMLKIFAEWTALRGKPEEVFPQVEAMLTSDDDYGHELLHQWQEMIQLITLSGIPEDRIILQPNLARNWEYYTGVVFGLEVEDQYIAAGGRYDDLAQLVTDSEQKIPAVGFTYYVDTLQAILGPEHEPSLTVANLIVTPETFAMGSQWADLLRQAGIATILSQDESPQYTQTLYIQPNGDVRFNDKVYDKNKINDLVVALRDTPSYE
ncbi:ATP phosphoribosyltransferase regulatory subunit [Phototrophicus methaneseepsis]|uniref:ATP phosphoribosyltransferase regulatory subunit n=1 Tax=Phototrophicus methaneseepsis TaxID=2710758 RepID=A0A7S8E6I7_9CHLR|nr:ATP phosphoribosyltransferase regulatory subunit [Phototrophicus methaneseepsis]QPC81218.1 ATP phosphoribosyltransferase regulatory subunit [Phototrophicus methaneseepsis]